MTGAGLPFRATKDLDIVLFVEALDSAFVRAFCEFVRTGGYEVQEKSTGEKQLYRAISAIDIRNSSASCVPWTNSSRARYRCI
jgi:hypothetical protein